MQRRQAAELAMKITAVSAATEYNSMKKRSLVSDKTKTMLLRF